MAAPAEVRLGNIYSEMSVSGISRMGTAALQDCVILELETRGLWEDPEVRWAYDFSMRLHDDEVRKDGPYINHINRAALWVVREMQPEHPAECAKAVLLHDVIENQADRVVAELGRGKIYHGTAQEQALAALSGSGRLAVPETCLAVGALTYPSFKGWPRIAKHQGYARHTLERVFPNPLAVIGKVGDRIDNANGNKYNPDPVLQRRLDLKYMPLHEAFVEAVLSPACLISPRRRDYIAATLEKGHQEAKQRLALPIGEDAGLSDSEISRLTLDRLLRL